MRLNDMTKEHRRNLDGETRVNAGKMSFGDALEIYKRRLDANATNKEGAKVYRRKCIKALVSSWPTIIKTPVGRISKDGCLNRAAKFAEKYSPSVYNNTVDTLRQIIAVAVKQGARYGNPATEITKRKILPKKLMLPSHEQFDDFIKKAESAGGWCSRDCADLIRFLAYGGFRKTEAANITWGDCDFDKGQINVRITKNGDARFVPMIPEMRQLLERVRAAQTNEAVSERVMRVQECQKAIDNAAKKVGMARITHHDLRHLFATRCIESGVDVPTVSRWLGHKDGGALAMRVYGLCATIIRRRWRKR
jgi:integrase